MEATTPLGALLPRPARLTEKQRRVLLSAFRLGYYDVPRRVSETISTALFLRYSSIPGSLRF